MTIITFATPTLTFIFHILYNKYDIYTELSHYYIYILLSPYTYLRAFNLQTFSSYIEPKIQVRIKNHIVMEGSCYCIM